MNPATPPRSRGSRKVNKGHQYVHEEDFKRYGDDIPFSTPKKALMITTPLTPSTSKQARQPLVLAPKNWCISSEKGLKSPECTPHCNVATGKRLLTFNEEILLLHKKNDEDEPTTDNEMTVGTSPIGVKNLFENLSSQVERESKFNKTVPGTPSHRVITEQMIMEWNEEPLEVESSDNDDNYNENNIYSIRPPNPFISDKTPSDKEIEIRKNTLINENPELVNSVTYINRKGDVVRKRILTSREKAKFKPSRLFFDNMEKREK